MGHPTLWESGGNDPGTVESMGFDDPKILPADCSPQREQKGAGTGAQISSNDSTLSFCSSVGWVERQRNPSAALVPMGFAILNPSYNSGLITVAHTKRLGSKALVAPPSPSRLRGAPEGPGFSPACPPP